MFAKADRHTNGARALVAVLALLFAFLPALARAADEPPWVAEKETHARELLRKAAAVRQAWLDAGSTGPRTFDEDLRTSESLLEEIVAAAPNAPRLYALAFVRAYLDKPELAHFACDRVGREFAGDPKITERCAALTTALHDQVYRVSATSEPSGATVTVEGWPAGMSVQTPAVVWLRPGERTLIYTMDGYQELRQAVNVQPDFAPQVNAVMRPVVARGTLELAVNPAGAAVELNGKPTDLPEGGRLSLDAGIYRLRVTLDGYVPYEEHITVRPNDLTTQWVDLRPVEVEPGREGEPELGIMAPPPPKGNGFAPWGWTGVAVGGATVVTGAVLHILAATDATAAGKIPNVPGRQSDFTAKRDAVRLKEITAWSLYGAGVVVAAAGILLLVFDDDGSEQPKGSVVPTALPSGGGLSWVGRF